MILTDAGPLIALIDKDDPDHQACRAVLHRISPPLTTVLPTCAEAMYLLGREGGFTYQAALWKMRADGLVATHYADDTELDRAAALMNTYRDMPMDLGDAAIGAAAEALKVQQIFTLDRHFYAYRLSGNGVFEVVP